MAIITTKYAFGWYGSHENPCADFNLTSEIGTYSFQSGRFAFNKGNLNLTKDDAQSITIMCMDEEFPRSWTLDSEMSKVTISGEERLDSLPFSKLECGRMYLIYNPNIVEFLIPNFIPSAFDVNVARVGEPLPTPTPTQTSTPTPTPTPTETEGPRGPVDPTPTPVLTPTPTPTPTSTPTPTPTSTPTPTPTVTDKTAPAVPLVYGGPPQFTSSTTDFATNYQNPIFTWTSDASAVKYEFKVTDSSTTFELTETTNTTYRINPLTDGNYNFEVRAFDEYGNVSNWGIIRFEIDITAPDVPSITATSPTNTTTPTWSWSNVSGASLYGVKLNNRLEVTTTSTNFTPDSPLQEGNNTIMVRAKDSVGNWGSYGSHTVTIDTTAPLVISFILQPSSPSSDTTPTWSWNTPTGATAFAYRQSNNGGSTYGGWSGWFTDNSYSPTLTENATYKIQIKCKDSVGNESDVATSDSFVLDTIAPTAPIFTSQPSSPSNDTTPTWGWSESSDITQVQYRYSIWKNGSQLGSWSNWANLISYTPNVDSGTYLLKIQAKDEAGNESDITTSNPFVLDTTASGIPSPSSSDYTNDTTPTWSWSAVDGAVTYRLKLNGVSKGDSNATSYTAPTLSEGNHTFEVASIDSAGNVSAFGSHTVTIDVTPPPAPAFTSQPPLYGHDPRPVWSWGAVSGAKLYYYRLLADSGNGPSVVLNWQSNNGSTLTYQAHENQLQTPAIWYLELKCEDSAGNESGVNRSTSYDFNAVTSSALTFSSQPSSPDNDTTPTWSWNAINKPGTNIADELVRYSYRMSSNAGSTYGDWSELSTSLLYTPTLVEGDYKLQVRYRNRYGKLSGVADSNIYVLDTTPPAVPSFTSQPSSPSNDTTPTWSWNSVSGASHYAYRISSTNGSTYGSWSSWSTSVSHTRTISVNATYKLQIKCKDSAGNESSITTSNSYVLDTTPPAVPSPSTTTPTQNQTITWSWNQVDSTSLYRLKLDGVSKGDTDKTSYTITNLSEGSHTFEVASFDSAGNVSAFGSHTVTIDVTPPSAPSFISYPSSPSIDTTPYWTWNTPTDATHFAYRQSNNDGNSYSGWSGWFTDNSYSPTLTENATYKIQIKCKDSVGNESDVATSPSFVLDTTPPPVPTITSTSGGLINGIYHMYESPQYYFFFDPVGQPMTYEFYMDNRRINYTDPSGDNFRFGYLPEETKLQPGPHTFKLVRVNQLGLKSENTFDFVIYSKTYTSSPNFELTLVPPSGEIKDTRLKIKITESMSQLIESDNSYALVPPNEWYVRIRSTTNGAVGGGEFPPRFFYYDVNSDALLNETNKEIWITQDDLRNPDDIQANENYGESLIGHSMGFEVFVGMSNRTHVYYDNSSEGDYNFHVETSKQINTELDLTPAFIRTSSHSGGDSCIKISMELRKEIRYFHYAYARWQRSSVKRVTIKVYELVNSGTPPLIKEQSYSLNNPENPSTLVGLNGIPDVEAYESTSSVDPFGIGNDWIYGIHGSPYIIVNDLPGDTEFFVQVELFAPELSQQGFTTKTNVTKISDSRYADISNYETRDNGQPNDELFLNRNATGGNLMSLNTIPANNLEFVSLDYTTHTSEHEYYQALLVTCKSRYHKNTEVEGLGANGEWIKINLTPMLAGSGSTDEYGNAIDITYLYVITTSHIYYEECKRHGSKFRVKQTDVNDDCFGVRYSDVYTYHVSTGVGLPYWGEGGTNQIYENTTTLTGDQIIHTDVFDIAEGAELTVNGDCIIIFAKQSINIHGKLRVNRQNWTYGADVTPIRANQHLNISGGGGGGAASSNGCPPQAKHGEKSNYYVYDRMTDTNSVTTGKYGVGGTAPCNGHGRDGGSATSGEDLSADRNYEWGDDAFRWSLNSTKEPLYYLDPDDNNLTMNNVPEHDKRFLNWNIPVETDTPLSAKWNESVEGSYKYLECPIDNLEEWGNKKLQIPIGLGGNGGLGGEGGYTGARTPGHGGAGGGCIILISPVVNIHENGIADASANTGGRNSGTSHFATGGGGGGGGGFVGICCQDSNLNVHHPWQRPGMTDDLDSSWGSSVTKWGPYSTGDLSYARHTGRIDIRGKGSDQYSSHNFGWGASAGGRGGNGASMIRMVGYHIVNCDRSGESIWPSKGVNRYAIAFAGLPRNDKNGNILAMDKLHPDLGDSYEQPLNVGDRLIEWNLSLSEAQQRLSYYRGLSSDPIMTGYRDLPVLYTDNPDPSVHPEILKYENSTNYTSPVGEQ